MFLKYIWLLVDSLVKYQMLRTRADGVAATGGTHLSRGAGEGAGRAGGRGVAALWRAGGRGTPTPSPHGLPGRRRAWGQGEGGKPPRRHPHAACYRPRLTAAVATAGGSTLCSGGRPECSHQGCTPTPHTQVARGCIVGAAPQPPPRAAPEAAQGGGVPAAHRYPLGGRGGCWLGVWPKPIPSRQERRPRASLAWSGGMARPATPPISEAALIASGAVRLPSVWTVRLPSVWTVRFQCQCACPTWPGPPRPPPPAKSPARGRRSATPTHRARRVLTGDGGAPPLWVPLPGDTARCTKNLPHPSNQPLFLFSAPVCSSEDPSSQFFFARTMDYSPW